MSNPIDLIQATEKIDPTATYRLTQSPPPHEIIEWRGPGEQPSEAELYAAWLKCTRIEAAANPFAFGAGTTIRVFTGEQEQEISVIARGVLVSLPVIGGVAEFDIAPMEAPTLSPHISITLADPEKYGDASLTLVAV